jgi:hypothetical protein
VVVIKGGRDPCLQTGGRYKEKGCAISLSLSARRKKAHFVEQGTVEGAGGVMRESKSDSRSEMQGD